jgi:hypothetical protein
MTVDLASSRMSCGHTPYAHLTISMEPYLVLIQRCSAGGKKFRLEVKSTVTLEACSSNGFLWFATLDVIALLSL